MARISFNGHTLTKQENNEKEFEEFFENLSLDELENAIKDIREVLKVENRTPLTTVSSDSYGTTSTDYDINNDAASSKKRAKRDTMEDTLAKLRSTAHSDFYSFHLQQNKQSMCRRRCFWKRMFALCRNGQHVNSECYC